MTFPSRLASCLPSGTVAPNPGYTIHAINEVRTGTAIQLSCSCGLSVYEGPPGRRADEAENNHIRAALNPSVAPRDAEARAAHHAERSSQGFWHGFVLGGLLGWLLYD